MDKNFFPALGSGSAVYLAVSPLSLAYPVLKTEGPFESVEVIRLSRELKATWYIPLLCPEAFSSISRI